MAGNSKVAWLLRLEGSLFGPFSETEVVKILSSGSMKGALYASRLGSNSWFLLKDVNQILQNTKKEWDGGANVTRENLNSKRKHSRIAIVATASKITPEGKLMIGVCANISKGGIQVLNSTSMKFELGELVELLIQPIASTGMESFTLGAKVAWIKFSVKKVGFQFITVSENASLQKYIDARKNNIELFGG